jgi:molybdopterin-guanine dinucleotide biosynthesis protein A
VSEPESWAAVVLAGGRGSRLGGVDKASVVVDGRTLLDHVLDAVAGARRIVVVGPRKDGVPAVTWAREDPPGGGPVAGLAAGLAHVRTDLVVVLAVDQPGITRSTVDRLLAAVGSAVVGSAVVGSAGVGDAGAVLVDDGGRSQWLTGAWRTEQLRRALPADPRNASMRSVLGPLDPVAVTARPGEAGDVDTPQDLARRLPAVTTPDEGPKIV